MKVILQPSLRGLSGKMGDWVYHYKKGSQKTYISETPVFTKDDTQAQLDQRERFGDANRFASAVLDDPVCAEFYQEMAEARGITPHNAACSDYFNVPYFKPLDLSKYKGQVGDPIAIRVENENGLVSLEVTINKQDGTDIEKGKAVEQGNRSGRWIYTATQPVALRSDVFIDVVGVDYTGREIKMTENPTVGVNRRIVIHQRANETRQCEIRLINKICEVYAPAGNGKPRRFYPLIIFLFPIPSK